MRRVHHATGSTATAAVLAAMLMLLGGRTASALLPTFFDWRDQGGVNYVSGVRNQGACGSVYIFAPVAMVESRQMIAAGRLGQPVTELDYSEQYLLSCGTGSHGAFGCSGGYPNEVLTFLRDTGAPREPCYLSRGRDEACPAACPDSGDPFRLSTPVTSASYQTYPGDTLLMQEIIDHGPVAVMMDYFSDFAVYDGGVYRHVGGGIASGTTMVTVVGWGTDGLYEYWIAKNSWGTWWGEDGYVRVDRAARGNCNFASFVYTCAVEVPPVTAVDGPPPPAGLSLQSCPNPFNPRTTIRFDVPAEGRVRLDVHDLRGSRVRRLLDVDLPVGSHEAIWDGRDEAGRALPSGAYVARLEVGGMVETVWMGLVR